MVAFYKEMQQLQNDLRAYLHLLEILREVLSSDVQMHAEEIPQRVLVVWDA